MKSVKKPITGKPLAWLLTLVYFSSYITRKNFATILQQVITDTQIEKDLLSIVLVCMTVTYGFGQIINGRLGDKFKPTNMIFCGLIMATAVNLLFPFFSGSVVTMAILWGINGFAQSMMWPPIVKILVSSCDDDMYGYSVVRISWGSSFATIALYFLAPLVISLTESWKAMFFISAAVGLLMVLFWFFIKRRITITQPEHTDSVESAPKAKFRIPRAALLPMIFIILGIIFQGMLRDGVATWMPTYLADVHQISNQESILSGFFPTLFSIASFSISGALYKRFFTNEVVCGAVVFGVSVLAAATLFVLFGKSSIVAILCMTLITGCMHGVNLMLITHVPKRFKKHGNISTCAGLVNACTYVGEAIFMYGIAVIADRFDWRFSIGTCLVIAILGTTCCFIAARPWKKFTDQ
ncbi:MAG: MFS transporter [Clostridia bacterium]|nr:MFS transporter [Clostridia bacterium]